MDDEADASRRVSRGVANLEGEPAQIDSLTVLEPQVRRRRRLHLETVHPALHRDVLVELNLVPMKADGQVGPEPAHEIGGAAGGGRHRPGDGPGAGSENRRVMRRKLAAASFPVTF